MPQTFTGSCYCRHIKYQIQLDDPDKDARTSICHCKNCKKFTGGPFGITTKIPRSSFLYKDQKDGVEVSAGEPEGEVKGLKVHQADNGSGTQLRREFCGICGSGILEYGANAGDFIYIFYGTLDKPGELPPKGEFFCKVRDHWMPEVPGLFQKREIKE